MVVPAIEVKGLGKRYRLGEDASRNRLANALLPWWRGSPTSEFWALRDVTFKVDSGEAIGIIGRNGAGKSTLLKLLSRITAPTEGRMCVRGRVGTLLEVGTGFHPELSGRDNIFLSGTILGLRYREVKAKFDEIVAFSEVEKFIDTPVKRYSSGMLVRLALSVALYLDPKILIVDEVLAVADLVFQHNSVSKLRNASAKDGRTVLFVSHSLDTVAKFCERIIVLDEGHLKFDGPVKEGTDYYMQLVHHQQESAKEDSRSASSKRATRAVRITKVDAFDSHGEQRWNFVSGETARFRIAYQVMEPVQSLALLFRLLDKEHAQYQKDDDDENEDSSIGGDIISDLREIVACGPLPPGYCGTIEIDLPKLRFWSGRFGLSLRLGDAENTVTYDVLDRAANLPALVVTPDSSSGSNRLGLASLNYEFRNIPAAAETIAAE
jgi:lipopolysaccharide transport system ATP-binding protein